MFTTNCVIGRPQCGAWLFPVGPRPQHNATKLTSVPLSIVASHIVDETTVFVVMKSCKRFYCNDEFLAHVRGFNIVTGVRSAMIIMDPANTGMRDIEPVLLQDVRVVPLAARLSRGALIVHPNPGAPPPVAPRYAYQPLVKSPVFVQLADQSAKPCLGEKMEKLHAIMSSVRRGMHRIMTARKAAFRVKIYGPELNNNNVRMVTCGNGGLHTHTVARQRDLEELARDNAREYLVAIFETITQVIESEKFVGNVTEISLSGFGTNDAARMLLSTPRLAQQVTKAVLRGGANEFEWANTEKLVSKAEQLEELQIDVSARCITVPRFVQSLLACQTLKTVTFSTRAVTTFQKIATHLEQLYSSGAGAAPFRIRVTTDEIWQGILPHIVDMAVSTEHFELHVGDYPAVLANENARFFNELLYQIGTSAADRVATKSIAYSGPNMVVEDEVALKCAERGIELLDVTGAPWVAGLFQE
jgi:hypothetical protein